MAKILLALPCYNEALNIVPLLRAIHDVNRDHAGQLSIHPIVINDCSTDNTIDILEEAKAKYEFDIVYHEVNKGLRGGINTAIECFVNNMKSDSPCDAFALMDGDNSHPPEFLPRMMAELQNGRDVVIASRFRKNSVVHGVTGNRQLLSLGLTLIFKSLRNIPGVRDYSCGYRLYSPAIMRKLAETYGNEVVTEKSFACMVELLVKCHLLGAKIGEVPFTLRYDEKLGESKMDIKATIRGNLKLLRALRAPKQP